MTQPTNITLINEGVNEGYSILFYAKSVDTTIPCYTTVEDKPHTSTTASYNDRLANGRNTGFANPEHNISGLFKIDAAHVTGSTGAVVDYEYLLEFAKNSHNVFTLSSTYWKTTSSPSGVVYAMLKSIKVKNVNDDTCSVTLIFQEVKV